MSDRYHNDDIELEALFANARAHPPVVSHEMMARVIADAKTMQPSGNGSRWRNWFAAFGGLTARGGWVTATCVGFWRGVAPPDIVPDLPAAVLGVETTANPEYEGSVINGYGWVIGEG